MVAEVRDDAKIRSLDAAVKAAQEIMAKFAPKNRILSDEIIAERRSEESLYRKTRRLPKS